MKAVAGIACVALAAAAACSSTAPEPELGTFVLRTVAGEPVPTPVFGAAGGNYLADTVRFVPRALAIFSMPTVERNTVVQLPGGGGVQTSVEHIGYERDGGTYRFQYACPPDTDCAIGFVQGTVSGDRLTVLLSPPYRSPLVYERLP